MLKIILSNLKKRKINAISTLITILLSVAVLVSLTTLYYGFKEGVAQKEERMGADLLAIPAGAEPYFPDEDFLYTGTEFPNYLDGDLVEKLEGYDSVAVATTQLYAPLNVNGKSIGILGFEPKKDWVITSFIDDYDVASLPDNGVVIGADNRFNQGDTLTIDGKDFTVTAVLDKSDTVLDKYVFMNIDILNKLICDDEEQGQLLAKSGFSNPVSAILLNLVEDPDTVGANSGIASVVELTVKGKVFVKSNSYETALNNLKIFFAILGGIAIILCCIVVFQLFARFFMSAWNRKKELSLYLALGAGKNDLRKLIAGEALLLTGFGSVIGIGAGIILYRILLSVLVKNDLPYVPPSAVIFGIIAVGILVIFLIISVIAVIYPLIKVSKIEPALAMKQGDID